MALEEEELLLKQLPHSVEAEQAVLGSMLIDPRCVPDVIEQLRPEDFYIRQNREIYETIYSMFNFSLTIDPVTVLENMRKNGVYDENVSRNYILQLMDTTPTAANVGEYVAIIKDKTLLRRIAETAGDMTAMVQQGTDSGQDVLEAAEQRVYAIRQGRAARGLTPISAVLLDVYDRLNELAASDAAVPGLSTGLGDLDLAISGLNKSDLILLAARPGMGKTSMALNILLHAGKFSGKSVAFFSLEMSREQLVLRLISNESFVDNKKLVTGKLNESDWEKVAAAADALNRTKILIDDDSTVSVADINAKCRRVEDLGLVVIDYLQLMTLRRRKGAQRRQPAADRLRHLPGPEDHGQGTERAGAVPVSALPCQREPDQQAAHALRSAGIGGHRAGRRYRHVPLPGGLLRERIRKPQPGRVHHRQKPARGDPDGGAPVAA